MGWRTWTMGCLLVLAPAGVWAQGLPADDEIVLPGPRAARAAPVRDTTDEPPARGEARPARPARSARATARSERRRHARRAERDRAERRAIQEEERGPSEELGSSAEDEAEDAEAARLEEEGIQYEVRQQIEWEERRRHEQEEAAAAAASRRELEAPRAREEDRAPERDDRGQARDSELERPRHRRREPAPEREPTPRVSRATPDPDLVRLEVGVSATTREQTIDVSDGSTVRFGLTPFASAFGAVVLTPLARLTGGPRGLGLALSYDRAIQMEAVADDEVLEASADHLAAMLLYRFELPGRVRLEPRIGYDLARFLLAPNETLPGIVYESIALGGNVQIPILRDPRTGDDRLRVRIGGAMYFPIGLGEAAVKYGQSGSASGFSFEGGLEGTVSGVFGYFALLRHASYSATFHAGTVATGGETTSEDGVTTGLCGGSVRF